MERRVGLRPLLMGPPLNDRDSDPTLTTLDSHLEAVAELPLKVYGLGGQQAQMQFKQFLQMEQDYDGVLRKRPLLFALGKEKELGDVLLGAGTVIQGEDGTDLSEDMKNRVLPFILPPCATRVRHPTRLCAGKRVGRALGGGAVGKLSVAGGGRGTSSAQ